jgi:hypothetical protein
MLQTLMKSVPYVIYQIMHFPIYLLATVNLPAIRLAMIKGRISNLSSLMKISPG